MKVAVLGSGAGALAVAADMSRHGRHTVMADLDDERAGLDPVVERGGVLVSDGGPGVKHPVDVAAAASEALACAALAVVVAPCDTRPRTTRTHTHNRPANARICLAPRPAGTARPGPPRPAGSGSP